MKRITLWGLLVAGAVSAQTSPFPEDLLARLQGINREIYSLNYERAAALCREMIAREPDHPAGHVYLAKTYWVEDLNTRQALSIDRFASSEFFAKQPRSGLAVHSESEKRFLDASDEAIRRSRDWLAKHKGDRAAQYLLGVAFQDRATFEVAFKSDWWAAMRFGGTSHRMNRELLAALPGFADSYLVTGVYSYVAGSLPWSVKWLAVLLGHSGNRERGKQELETAAARALLAGDDARAVLSLIYTREKRFDQAAGKMAELRLRYPENYIAHLELAGLELRRKRTGQAIAIYGEILSLIEAGGRYRRLEPAVVHNRMGVAYRVAGKTNTAIGYFQRVMESASASDQVKTIARLELGKTLDITGRREEAVALYRAVASAEDYAGSRPEAARLLARPFRP